MTHTSKVEQPNLEMADTPTTPDWYYIVGSAKNCPICKTTEPHFQAVSKEILTTHKIPTIRIDNIEDYKTPLADLAKWPKDLLTYIPPGFPFVLLVRGSVWEAATAQVTSILGPSEPVKLKAFMLDWRVDDRNQLLPNHLGYARTKAGMLLWISACIGSGISSDKIPAKPMVPGPVAPTVIPSGLPGPPSGAFAAPKGAGRGGSKGVSFVPGSVSTVTGASTCGVMTIHPKRRR